MSKTQQRTALLDRQTTETEIRMSLNLDGTGRSSFKTEIPFLEHMLDHVSRHGQFDIELILKGDLQIDAHHSVEDTAIVFGQLFAQALGDKKGISRYGHFTLPMDEVLVTAAVDLSGRYHFEYKGPEIINEGKFGVYDAELTLEFLRKLAMHTGMNLHILVHHGENRHHIHEGIFKALGRALRMAVAPDSRSLGTVPSTKGVL